MKRVSLVWTAAAFGCGGGAAQAQYPRTISFSGYTWSVKTSVGPVGPGPNYFSDSTNNVSVDAQGRLHLRITHTGGNWYCAEIVCQRTLGYGNYVFHVDGTPATLDANVVLGLFTWSNAT